MKPSSARIVTETLKNNEVQFITVLPDGWMFEVYEVIYTDPHFQVVPVTHEAEGVNICAGAWCGGMRSATIMENSGLRAATEALGRLYCFPVLLPMSCRGDKCNLVRYCKSLKAVILPTFPLEALFVAV